VLAAFFVGGTGIAVALTGHPGSGPDQMMPVRTTAQPARDVGCTTRTGLVGTPTDRTVSVGPTDIAAPMSPTAAETIDAPLVVPDSAGSGAAGPVPAPTTGTPSEPRPTDTAEPVPTPIRG
jgi:hypothetical protein